MTQRQQYAVVPRIPTDEMLTACCESIGYWNLEEFRSAWPLMDESAPPPPDQVLSDDKVMAVYHEWLNVPGHATESDLIRLAERAVLQNLQGAKNGE